MDLGDLPGVMLFAEVGQLDFYRLHDLHRNELARERASRVDREIATQLRNEILRRLGSLEVFPAGIALTRGPDGREVPRHVDVAVTASDFILLDADDLRRATPHQTDGIVARIPRSDVTSVRLLDEDGDPVTYPPSEVQELDLPDRQYLVWVDRTAPDGSGGHVFAFRAWSVANEAKRDFERSAPNCT
jgi:hypothetical protein